MFSKSVFWGLILFSAVSFGASLKELGQLKSPFVLPELPYAENAFEAVIDSQTMNIHHKKHHQAYVDNTNKALAAASEVKTLDEIFKNASKLDPKIKNNAGGHWNHSFYWTTMSPKESDHTLSKPLIKAIEKDFQSVELFKEQFVQAGVTHFGSGWVWLIVDANKTLKITTTSNQDNPLMDSAAVQGTPILGVDLWEHAYYLKYQNNRAAHLKALWSIINWKQVDKYYKEAKK